MGRRNLFAGRRNGSRAAQIVPESPGRQRPTTETADAAGEEVLETPGALSQPGSLLRRPMRTADPSGPFRKNQNLNRSTQVRKSHAWRGFLTWPLKMIGSSALDGRFLVKRRDVAQGGHHGLERFQETADVLRGIVDTEGDHEGTLGILVAQADRQQHVRRAQ